MACPNNQLKLQNKVEDLQGVQQEGMDIFGTKRITGNLGTGTKQSVTAAYIAAANEAIAVDEAAAKTKHRIEHSQVTKYDLAASGTNVTIVVKRNGVAVTPGDGVLKGQEIITAEATPATGYDLDTFTVNSNAYTNNASYKVIGNTTFAATGKLKQFALARTETDCTITVTKGGDAVTDGNKKITYGDVLTITATADAEKEMKSLTVNDVAFESGSTITVTGDVTIVGVAEAPAVEDTPGT